VKVLLRTDVEGLGRTGDLVEVARGYARNYLVPQGRAVEAGSGMTAQAETMQRKRALQAAADKSDAEESAARLEGLVLQVTAKASEEGRLFGSVTSQMIVDAIAEKGYTIDKKEVEITETISHVGKYFVNIKLGHGFDARVKIKVSAEK